MTLPQLAAVLTLCALVGSCGDGRREQPEVAGDRSAASAPHAASAAELEAAAADVVGFLQGTVPFDRLRLADTVVLYVAPEGGGGRAVLERGQLREPSRWIVRSGRQRYPFVPPASATRLTLRAGRHLDCIEHPLSSRVAELARLPHVGTKLEPESSESCLQAWNLTLVFDPAARPPRLVAAVYDQWEW